MSLSTYLTGIADAIREKKGTSEPINAQNFATEIKGIETSENLDAELTAQDEALTSLESAVDNLPEPKPDRLQWKCDNVKHLKYEFEGYTGTSLDDALEGLDTSNVTNINSMFNNCSNLTDIPLFNTSNVTSMSSVFRRCTNLTTIPQLDTSKAISMQYMFYVCTNLTTIPQLDTSKANDMSFLFSSCSKLTTIPLLDMINATNTTNVVSGCKALTNLTLKNIKISLQIGSGTTFGHLLTLDSLINTIKELWDLSSGTGQTLTMGTTNKEKIANTYVKLITPTEEQLAADQYLTNKMPCEVCESTDEDAMTLEAYANLKNWTIA